MVAIALGPALPGTAAAAGSLISQNKPVTASSSESAAFPPSAAVDGKHDKPVADPAAPDLHSNPGMRMITMTWLIHDVRVWRVDHVFTDQDVLWVESSQSFDNLNPYERGTVHRPANHEALTKVLDQVLATSVTRTALTLPAPTPTPPVAEGLEWTSVLIGAVCGGVLVFVGRVGFRLVSRRQA